MKWTRIIFTGLFIGMLFASGCQENTAINKGVEVIIEGNGDFPESLAGRWKSDKHGWEVVFDRNGSILSVVLSFGRIEVLPGQITTLPMKMGGQGVVEPGVWTVQYDPATRELAVEINIKNYRMELGGDIVEGSLSDLLVGEVSEDGQLWLAEWFSSSDYIVSTSKYKKYELPQDEYSDIRGSLIFTKVVDGE